MNIIYQILILIASYLLGSIPFGSLIAKAHGVDIAHYGSGNTGATNVFRVVGKGAGFLTLLLDLLKGFLPVALFRYSLLSSTLCIGSSISILSTSAPLLLGFASILGHVFPIFHSFKGGKAVATSAGVILAFSPFSFLVGLLTFIIVMIITRYVSLSSLFALLGALIMMTVFAFMGHDFLALPHDFIALAVTGLLSIVILIRHITNIRRLKNHQEMRIHWHHEKNVAEMEQKNDDDKER